MGAIFPTALGELVSGRRANQRLSVRGTGRRNGGVIRGGNGGIITGKIIDRRRGEGGGGNVGGGKGVGAGWSRVGASTSGTGGGVGVWMKYYTHLPDISLHNWGNLRTLLAIIFLSIAHSHIICKRYHLCRLCWEGFESKTRKSSRPHMWWSIKEIPG